MPWVKKLLAGEDEYYGDLIESVEISDEPEEREFWQKEVEKSLEEKKIDKLYELLQKGNLDNEISASLKWAIFELESMYGKEEITDTDRYAVEVQNGDGYYGSDGKYRSYSKDSWER